MRKRIQDEFTELPISRQRKYQLRMQRDKRCTECGQPAIQGSRCLKHWSKRANANAPNAASNAATITRLAIAWKT